jgi:hypothetical protein
MKPIVKLMAAAAAGAFAADSIDAAAPADNPITPVKMFLESFNRGDISRLSAAQRGATLAIMDEVPPHIWLGARAVDAWMSSLNAYDKAHGRTDGAVLISMPQVTTIEGASAYVVVPAVYSFKQNGRRMRETATMTFALHHAALEWKIAGWTWNGTAPVAIVK